MSQNAKIVLGADMSAISNFVPWMGILNGAMGGGGKPAQESEQVKMMRLQLEQQEAARKKSEANVRLAVYGALGLGAFGLIYLLLKR